MKTFNFKDQLYTCEVVTKNTNPVAKSKCVRIITQDGVRNIYTIANGYSKPIAYDKNRIILSDIVIGKAFAVLGLMQNGKKFVFNNNNTDTVSPVPTSSTTITTTSTSNHITMYRIIDTNTGSVAMFSSETDVVAYCIGKTVKVDKVEISTNVAAPHIIPNTEIDITNVGATTPDIETTIKQDDVPKRRKRTDYTSAKSDNKPDAITDIPIENIPECIPCVEEVPKRRKKV